MKTYLKAMLDLLKSEIYEIMFYNTFLAATFLMMEYTEGLLLGEPCVVTLFLIISDQWCLHTFEEPFSYLPLLVLNATLKGKYFFLLTHWTSLCSIYVLKIHIYEILNFYVLFESIHHPAFNLKIIIKV